MSDDTNTKSTAPQDDQFFEEPDLLDVEDEEADAETIVDGRQLELPEMGPPEKTGEGQ